jgi:opacity protein-like surface antigen
VAIFMARDCPLHAARCPWRRTRAAAREARSAVCGGVVPAEAPRNKTCLMETSHMKKTLLLLILLIAAAPSLFAQDDSWRDRGGRDRYRDRDRSYDNAFELTPFVGYRWGGTLTHDAGLFNENLNLESSANIGINFGIPLPNNMKLALTADHQQTHLTEEGVTLFDSGQRVADIDVTYYQASLEVPFNRNAIVSPFFMVGAGVANISPGISGVSDANRFAANAGIGVKVPFNRNAGLRAEVRGYFSSLNNNDNCASCTFTRNDRNLYQGETNLGVYFRF